jgi:hypothetical protein
VSSPDPLAEIALIPEGRRFGRVTAVITGLFSERASLASGYARLAALLEATR